MENFVIFKKQEGEIVNAYSLVDDETLSTVPKDIIHKVIKVENGHDMGKDEFEKLRDENL